MLISSCSYAGGRTATAKKRILAVRCTARHAQGDVSAARDVGTAVTMGRRFEPPWIRGGRDRDASGWAGPCAAHQASWDSPEERASRPAHVRGRPRPTTPSRGPHRRLPHPCLLYTSPSPRDGLLS